MGYQDCGQLNPNPNPYLADKDQISNNAISGLTDSYISITEGIDV